MFNHPLFSQGLRKSYCKVRFLPNLYPTPNWGRELTTPERSVGSSPGRGSLGGVDVQKTLCTMYVYEIRLFTGHLFRGITHNSLSTEQRARD